MSRQQPDVGELSAWRLDRALREVPERRGPDSSRGGIIMIEWIVVVLTVVWGSMATVEPETDVNAGEGGE
jgi:hypothetical protein